MATDSDSDFLLEQLSALQSFLYELLPPLIVSAPNRTQIEAHLRALADQETSSAEDPDLHHRAEMAEELLRRIEQP